MKNFLEDQKWSDYVEEHLKEIFFFRPDDPWLFMYEKGNLR